MSKAIKSENQEQPTFAKLHKQLQNSTMQSEEYLTDLKFLLSFIKEPFRGDPQKISSYLNQIHLAYELCDPSLRHKFFLILQSTVEGEPRERMREYPEEIGTTRLTHLGYRALLASKNDTEIETQIASGIIKYAALRRFKLGTKSDISKYLLGNSLAIDLTSATRYAVEFEQQINQSKKTSQPTSHNKYCSFCRTRAETSLIKYEKLNEREKQVINNNLSEPINGVNGITEFTLSKTLIRFNYEGHTYEFRFYIV
ncbi:hypothetical protein PGB90_008374 [Kerria lacca]